MTTQRRPRTAFRLLALALFTWACIALLTESRAYAAGVTVPERCRQYQRLLTGEARLVLGQAAPTATLAAQIHQESGCRSDARSAVGALGLTQFMPATARDMGERYPQQLGSVDPLYAPWAIGAQVRYMRDLMRRNPGVTECDTWAFGLSSYNGGEGWLRRDQARARSEGVRADAWFGAVETTPDPRRAAWAVRENRGYPRRILLTIEPAYVAAGWGRGVGCEAHP